MKNQYRVVVIGGGVVGTSVLYHLAKFGWKDVCLLERSVLTAGSSWHAAGGFHALNADPNMAALQAYTIDLLSEIEKESGQNIGMHMTGGLTLAGTPDRWEWLQSTYRIFQSIGIDDCELLTPEEAQKRCPIMSTDGVLGASVLPICMRLCHPRVAATQFTIYMALTNFGITFGAFALSRIDSLGGLPSIFLVVGGGMILSLTLLLTVKFPRRSKIPEQLEAEPGGALS